MSMHWWPEARYTQYITIIYSCYTSLMYQLFYRCIIHVLNIGVSMTGAHHVSQN